MIQGIGSSSCSFLPLITGTTVGVPETVVVSQKLAVQLGLVTINDDKSDGIVVIVDEKDVGSGVISPLVVLESPVFVPVFVPELEPVVLVAPSPELDVVTGIGNDPLTEEVVSGMFEE